jgi:hypothetical protein
MPSDQTPNRANCAFASERDSQLVTQELCGPKNGSYLLRQYTGSNSAVECWLTGGTYELHLHLVHGFLCGQHPIVDLLPVACGSKGALFKMVSRLRDHLGDRDRDIVVSDGGTLYHLDVESVVYAPAFVLCRTSKSFDSILIDEIICAIDKRTKALA